MQNIRQQLIYAMYFAPRGRERLLQLGDTLTQRHLKHSDRLIGIVGDAGSGKSLIIRGMFPGLNLANDDDNIDASKIMQVRRDLDFTYKDITYHMDMRFQMAFTQMFEIVDFVKGALRQGRRVIIEHFDLLYPFLGINADLMIGIGEEIIVTKPNIFGPLPKDIYDIVFHSLKNRKMAHTAEDLTTMVLQRQHNMARKLYRSDVRGGFVMSFDEEPGFDIPDLQERVKKIIDDGLQVSYYDENHIKVGESDILDCQGPRIHVRNTSEIVNFHLLPEIKYDWRDKVYCLVGLVSDRDFDENDLNKISGDKI